MSISAPIHDNPLDFAVGQLRNICEGERLQSSIDAGSLRRMLVHITNINLSVLASTQDHVNATKRLNDFALSLARIAKNADPPDEALKARLPSVSENLRAASEELARSDGIPNWRTPASMNGS